jgi:tRNA nucleotidyltransferase (CCA-adding enzyme)
MFELEQRVLSDVKRHLGPPLELERECDSFLAKYTDNNDDVIAGPFIDGGRWVVELHRKHTDAAQMLRSKVARGGRDVGVAELIAKAAEKAFGARGEEITEITLTTMVCRVILTDFFRKTVLLQTP